MNLPPHEVPGSLYTGTESPAAAVVLVQPLPTIMPTPSSSETDRVQRIQTLA
jgi:hypothetical protein